MTQTKEVASAVMSSLAGAGEAVGPDPVPGVETARCFFGGIVNHNGSMRLPFDLIREKNRTDASENCEMAAVT